MFKLISYNLILCLLAVIVNSDNSFTIVIDTTKSMNYELDNIKVMLPYAVSQINYDFDNYIIVPFNYPGVLDHVIVNQKQDLASSLSGIIARGGQDCPENVLESIERALQISKNGSNIFVFTDAYPRDEYKLPSVENLCSVTGSKVTIFLSGFCSPKPAYPNISPRTYYDVARACSGSVLLANTSTLRQAHTIIKEVTKKEWTDINVFDTVDNYKQFSFTVDVFTKQALLIVSGKDLIVQISSGQSSNNGIEKMFHSRDIQAYHMTVSSKEEFTVTVRSRSKISATLYKQHHLPINIGFSPISPRSMFETSKRPISGRTDYILLDASQGNFKLVSVDIELIGSSKTRLTLVERPDSLYLTKAFIDPDKGFRLWIRGYQSAYPDDEVSGTSEVIYPQETVTNSQWIQPTSQILDPQSITVDFTKNITLACKVIGYPKPSIWWEDDSGTKLPSEDVLLEIPLIHISYVTINVTQNSTIGCNAKNSKGQAISEINLYVYRPFYFNILQTPSDTTIDYGNEDKLYCEVSAYPEPEIKWYHNDTEVTGFGETEILHEENALLIKNMTLDKVGVYKCEISNSVNTTSYSVDVNIAGIESPKVDVANPIVTLKLGDQSNIECGVVNGKPSPKIVWKYKSSEYDDFDTLPEGVEVDEGILKVTSAQNIHKGIYKCIASNFLGEDSAEITVNLQYPPLIKDPNANIVIVKEDEEVSLPCVVDADPAPRVYWEMWQDDVIMALGHHHRTDRENTHHFTALWNDSGNYHCVAENSLGRDEKIFTVNVLVKPFIDPQLENVTVRLGGNAVITCNVTFGNPVPTTTLEFVAPNSKTTVLARQPSSITHVIANINQANEGVYRCIAENSVGTDTIKIYVKVL